MLQHQSNGRHARYRCQAEEGLFTYFQHQGAPHSPSFGNHTIIIADHYGSFTPNAQSRVAVSQPGAVMQKDSIDRWRSIRNAIDIASWDCRTANTRAISAHSAAAGGAANSSGAITLISSDAPGTYAFENRTQGERIAKPKLNTLSSRLVLQNQ
ncbi:MAG: hypothetical protein HHJ09_13470 [Glaciimonas sp.]|nr:hypothetical protein [Glaciimonas sp.]